MNPADGWMSSVDLEVLKTLATNKRVLEIGTWKGRSALEMAKVAAEVWCCDTFCGDVHTEEAVGRQFTLPEFIDNARQRGVWDKLRLLVGRWQDILPKMDLSYFQFIFYDAGHSYEETFEAGRLILIESEDSVVGFHDYGANWPDVMLALHDLDRDYPFRRLQKMGDVLGVFT